MSLSSSRTLAEAFDILGKFPTVVAGCTDLLVVDHATGRSHAALLDVTRVEELHGIRVEQGALDIGAAVTFTEIRESEAVRRYAPALCASAATIGAWQIQNRATIGGNIANASPAGDSLPVLLALDASLELVGPRGGRRVAYCDFHTGYRTTVLGKDELISRVLVPFPPSGSVQGFRKVGTREAQAVSKVVVAIAAQRDGSRLVNARVGIGSVAPTPIRLPNTERLINTTIFDTDVSQKADAIGKCVEEEISPIDDVRSTADYRRYAAGRIVRRFVLDLLR